MTSTIIEGKARIRTFSQKIVTKDMPVFYNPIMAVNRDVSIALILSLGRKKLSVADPLCASGIRAARFAKELPRGTLRDLALNDANPQAIRLARANMRANPPPHGTTVRFSTCEASQFLLASDGFDYIDIDPFGSPNPFLDASIRHLTRGGILAVTATDTAALCGSAPGACARKYWATPLHGPLMQETGLRILTRKVQLIGAQYEKVLVPVYSHATGHYLRIYFQHHKSRSAVAKVLKKHQELYVCQKCLAQSMDERMCKCAKPPLRCGPLWSGQLWDAGIAKRMNAVAERLLFTDESKRLLARIAEEASVTGLLHPIHAYGRMLHKSLPRMDAVMLAIRKAGYSASLSHINQPSVRSTIPAKALAKIIRSLDAHR